MHLRQTLSAGTSSATGLLLERSRMGELCFYKGLLSVSLLQIWTTQVLIPADGDVTEQGQQGSLFELA